jgi:hypothetical protein
MQDEALSNWESKRAIIKQLSKLTGEAPARAQHLRMRSSSLFIFQKIGEVYACIASWSDCALMMMMATQANPHIIKIVPSSMMGRFSQAVGSPIA